MRSTLSTLTKQTMGRVGRRTYTKQRSMMLVVRSLRHRMPGRGRSAYDGAVFEVKKRDSS
jgi:hypothetical protein